MYGDEVAPDPSSRSVSLRRTVQRWFPSVLLTGAAVIPLVGGSPDGTTVVISGVMLVLACLLSPLLFPRTQEDAAARKQAGASEVPLIYWRPGCVYCVRLRLALGRSGNRAVWVDVSRDDEASARVRRANHGDETVPTVFLGNSARVNPAPSWVRSQLKTT